MAPISKTLALAGALFAITGHAAPFNKRAVVWETVTNVVWETVDVTTTIYPGQTQPTVVPVVATTTTAVATEVTSTAPEAQVSQADSSSQEETSAAAPTTTEQAVPTTTAQQAPATTAAPVEQAPAVQAAAAPESSSTSSAAPAVTQSTNSGSSSKSSTSTSSGYNGACSEGSPCNGDITYYDTATTMTNPSSCGTTNDGMTELVLALPHGIMTDGDCGKSVTIEYNGVSKTGTVVDKCMGCDNNSIDLSRAFFEAVAGSLDAGRISDVKWYIN
ncbi:Allergen Asp f 7 [Penicillium oxalicum]|uniref:Uncharacterized protein n=1 Tax=Penicillium oxalicum (strain 114-2 / CGMCC 5302) TaxID=933388 RepID=S7ZKJ6_PENO1|nr:Allergen Asp f 7 [Penicillium oxalicum]EPS31170.1 hypothetical protein PDE_06125 [Penicillium oxalicum 114-2]KAI2785712.1 Allergen Asp f 7 [Penicillium oxalicum]